MLSKTSQLKKLTAKINNLNLSDFIRSVYGIGSNSLKNERNWRMEYQPFSPVGDQLLKEAEDTLSNPFCIAKSLKMINETVQEEATARQFRGHVSTDPSDTPLHRALLRRESDHAMSAPVKISDTLSVESFFEALGNGSPLIDEGVSVFHGAQTHRIQFHMLCDNLGSQKAKDIMKVMGDEVQMRTHPLRARMPSANLGSRVTIWDEIFDVSSPWHLPNEKSLPVGEVLDQYKQEIIEPNFLPCMDARSPEWLQFLMVSAPTEIDAIKDSIAMEVKGRLNEVHQDIFVTGLESKPEYKEVYGNLGFKHVN